MTARTVTLTDEQLDAVYEAVQFRLAGPMGDADVDEDENHESRARALLERAAVALAQDRTPGKSADWWRGWHRGYDSAMETVNEDMEPLDDDPTYGMWSIDHAEP